MRTPLARCGLRDLHRLAHLLGIDLLLRIRNFQDLTFHCPDPQVRYRHIDALFSTDPRT
ncbi:hypothetical protein ACFU7X_36190 [Streptomyces chartreusis]|uniref:hypothetical protein n=1 Tax=Streptomyces chartreusis TaxID=1969 RepID=UPI003690580E